MKLKNLNKALVVGAVALTATTGLIASTITTASADPTRPYVATGSDTIQDVWNGLTNDFGAVAPSVGSWNAFVNPPSAVNLATAASYIQTKTGGAWFLRPAGSGDGMKSLSAVWDPSYSSHLYPGAGGALLNHEDVDFARSSSGPSGTTGLKYLPFARDAVSIAYNPEAGLPAGLSLTAGQITELYTGVDATGDSKVTFSPAGTVTASTHVFVDGAEVHPQVPQNNSGTRKFFLAAIGITAPAQIAPYIPNSNSALPTGLPENDGGAIPNDGDLIPFSAAQWVAQGNGKATDTTAGLELASIGGVAAISGTSPNLTAGALFGHKTLNGDYDVPPTGGLGVFNRDTYDIVPTLFLSGTAKQQALVTILGSGIGGAAGKGVIRAYGFGSLSYIGNTTNFLEGSWQH